MGIQLASLGDIPNQLGGSRLQGWHSWRVLGHLATESWLRLVAQLDLPKHSGTSMGKWWANGGQMVGMVGIWSSSNPKSTKKSLS